MKYALISEDQIKQIEDALKFSSHGAVKILESLKPSEPAAFIENHKAGQNLSWSPDDLPYAKATKLYALDEVTK